MDNAEFLKLYANLPVPERKLPICVLDGKPFSWHVVAAEVKGGTALSKRMLESIEKLFKKEEIV